MIRSAAGKARPGSSSQRSSRPSSARTARSGSGNVSGVSRASLSMRREWRGGWNNRRTPMNRMAGNAKNQATKMTGSTIEAKSEEGRGGEGGEERRGPQDEKK